MFTQERKHKDEESSTGAGLSEKGEKKQRDGTGELIWVRFNEHLINYGWKGRGGDTKERKKGKVRIKKDQ